MKSSQIFLFLSLLVSGPAWAQETPNFETVVEDVVFNTSSRVTIDEKTIKDSRAPNITTLLSTQANVTITNTPFQPNSIFIRGGDSSHVLILVDGVPFYDASTIQRTFNLNSLDIRSIRRIEIIKGSQTVLYGGQALSGVIKIDTIPQDFSSKTGIQGQVGTQRTRELSFTHMEALTENDLLIGRAHGGWKDAESPVLNSSKTYERNNWSGEGAYAWKGNVEGYLKGNYIQDKNFSPTSSFVNYQIIDVDDFEQYSRQLAASSVLKFNTLPWTPRLSLSAQNSYRELDQGVGPTNATGSDEDYGANLRTVRVDVTPFKNELVGVTAGVSYNYEDFVYRSRTIEQSNRLSEQRGLFTKIDINPLENLQFSVGGRVESWDSQDSVSTYQAGITFFKNTKLELSTGYKIPSLFQLYSSYGNPNLQVERATVYSLTQDVDFTERQKLSVTFFVSEFSNLITVQGGPGGLRYNNVNRAESRGAELSYNIRPSDTSSLLFTYGYQEPKDLSTGRWLARRPLVNGGVRYTQYINAHTGTFEIQGAGERLDRNGNAATAVVSLPGYAIANASYSYDFGRGISAYTRVNNLLDYRYQETYSYYTEGLSAQLGAEIWF